MSRRILDTNLLIEHWRTCLKRSKRRRLSQISESDVKAWAQDLVDLEDSNAVVTPILLEFLCGVRDETEMKLARAFLKVFNVIDRGRILDEDWQDARRIAERVPPTGASRDFGDCLI